MSDRAIQQASYLYGVRFGAQTQYCLLDIDSSSFYHPSRDPFAISRIVAALESLGLVSYLTCASSYSGGLHLYFPFPQSVSSWQIAIAVTTLIENAGFKISPGQLEVFPNPKPYSSDGTLNLFNAHRLPLQISSYLLNADFEPIWSTQQQFVEQWKLTQNRNELDLKRLKQILKQAKRRQFHLSGKADQFINDLNAEIELGWTGAGQTNRLLGRITMRTYIFQHILTGGEPLEGRALVDEIAKIARSLPGYQEWCNHQHEIEHRAEEWARCIENSHYFHYGDPYGKFKAKSNNEDLENAVNQAPNWNQQQSEEARDRIRSAIADLIEKGALPINATARFKALIQYKIGGGSLYRHRDLWHPNFLTDASFSFSKSDLDQKQQYNQNSDPTLDNENTPSLLPSDGGNITPSNDSSASSLPHSDFIGRNLPWNQPCGKIAQDYQNSPIEPQTELEQQARQEAHRAAIQIAQQQQPTEREPSVSQLARMQQYFDSGDPILQAEALAWSRLNPGWLRLNSLHCDREAISD